MVHSFQLCRSSESALLSPYRNNLHGPSRAIIEPNELKEDRGGTYLNTHLCVQPIRNSFFSETKESALLLGSVTWLGPSRGLLFGLPSVSSGLPSLMLFTSLGDDAVHFAPHTLLRLPFSWDSYPIKYGRNRTVPSLFLRCSRNPNLSDPDTQWGKQRSKVQLRLKSEETRLSSDFQLPRSPLWIKPS